MTRARRAGLEMVAPTPSHLSTARSDPFQVLAAEHAILRRDFARLVEPSTEESGRLGDLASLAHSLELHLRREELVVYPVAERLFGGKDGAASVLRDEHASIRDRLQAMAKEAREGRGLSLARADMLRLLVDDHFRREERVLFPLAAAFLSGPETGALARRLRDVPRP